MGRMRAGVQIEYRSKQMEKPLDRMASSGFHNHNRWLGSINSWTGSDCWPGVFRS